jgi:hypothetical protein
MNLAIDPENRAIAREEMNIMKRRTLDIAFSIGGVIFSVLLLVVGLILNNQKNFATDYVHRELSAQKIYFQPTKTLPAEMQSTACLVKYGQGGAADHGGAQLMTTGKMAECYANNYIAVHMEGAAKAAGYDGATFSSLGAYTLPGSGAADSISLADQLAAAKKGGDQTKIDAATAALAKVQGLRTTLQTGETLRGLLLTTYGFSIFGERAGQAAWVLMIGAVLIFLLSLAGFVHAFASKKADDVILVAEHHEPKKELVNA